MKRAIVTLAIGPSYERMGSITHALMEAYAERCSADFVVIKQGLPNVDGWPGHKYEKFQVWHLLQSYERIAFIDTDILVNPLAPSLFDAVRPECFAASAVPYSMADRDKQLTQQVLGPVQWVHPYFNSGVMVFSFEHRGVFDPAEKNLHLWAKGEFRKQLPTLLNDQPYLNHRINALRLRFQDLGERFNHTRAVGNSSARFQSYMIHYAGDRGHRYGSRLAQLEKDRKVFANRLAFFFSRRAKSYRWVADRLDSDFARYLAGK